MKIKQETSRSVAPIRQLHFTTRLQFWFVPVCTERVSNNVHQMNGSWNSATEYWIIRILFPIYWPFFFFFMHSPGTISWISKWHSAATSDFSHDRPTNQIAPSVDSRLSPTTHFYVTTRNFLTNPDSTFPKGDSSWSKHDSISLGLIHTCTSFSLYCTILEMILRSLPIWNTNAMRRDSTPRR